MKHVLIGAPTYDGTRYNSIPIARVLRQPPEGVLVNLVENSGSLLAHSFNSLLCAALNLRVCEVPVTHFLLMHADIVPEQADWLAILLREMEEHKAEALSAVVPIKNDSGLTSTAWDTDPWNPMRLTLTELESKPLTWTEPNLLINSGLLLIDMSKPWVEKFRFHIDDMIVKDEDGVFHTLAAPEDWNFSRDIRKLGVDSYATRAVTINHLGKSGYSSSRVWGYPSDALYRAAKFEEERPSGVPPRD